MNSETLSKYDLAFFVGAVLVLAPLFYFLSAEDFRTLSYMLMLTSYFVGRAVGKKISSNSE